MFKAQIDVEVLEECVEAIVGVVDEAVLNIAIDGLEVRAVDPANVAMVSLKLQSSIFDSFEFEAPKGEDRLKIGVGFANLLGLLKLWERKSVKLELDEKAETLFIKSDCFDCSNSLIEPSALRRVPKTPQITYLIQTHIEAERFINAIRAQERVDDTVYIGVKGEELYMWAEGEGNKLKIALGKLSDIRDRCSSYSLDYLSAMCKGMHTDMITLFTGYNNTPLQIDFNIAHGKGKVSYLLAPRLLPED